MNLMGHMKKRIIIDSFYLSSDEGLERGQQITGLPKSELIELVGIFGRQSSRAGLVRGEIVVYDDGSGVLRHHFNKKTILKFNHE